MKEKTKACLFVMALCAWFFMPAFSLSPAHDKRLKREQVLHYGGKMENTSVQKNSPNRFMFDYEQMVRFGPSSFDLPPESILINVPSSFHSRHRGSVWLASITIALLILFVGMPGLNNISCRNVEMALRKSEERYRSLFEQSRDGIAIVTYDGRFLDVNRSFLDLFGYGREELMGLNAKDLWADPADRSGWQREMTAKGFVEGYKWKARRKDGELRDLMITSSERRVEEGPPQYQTIARDVTEWKKADEAVQQSEKRFRELFDSVTDLIYTQDLDGRFLTANRAMTDLFAYDPHDFLGKKAADFMKPEMRPFFESVYLAELKKKGHHEGTSSYFTKDGRKLYLEYRSTLVRPVGGTPYISGISRDVTDRLAADRNLRAREERIRVILQASPNPMIVYDTEGNVQFINPAFTEVFGWSLDELKGKRIPFVPPEQQGKTTRKIRELYEVGAPLTIETRRSTRDGRVLETLVNASLIRGSDGTPDGMVVGLTDLTEKMRMELALQQAQKMEAVGTLAGGVAHDFNNLLMGIQGNISLMLMETDAHHSNYEKLKTMEKYVRQGADLSKQLLGVGRGGKYEVKPTDLNVLIQNEIQMFSRTRKEIRVHQTYEKDLLWVSVDRGQMAQVLLNLCINASHAMPGGGDLYVQTENADLVEDHLRPFQLASDRYVKISLTDTGVGMDEETRQRIFEPFFTTKEMGRGSGLGLASVYGIVKNHGGIIKVSSEKDHGTTFNIYLPAMKNGDFWGESEPKKKTHILKADVTILLVDDEEMILEIGKAFLEKMGCHALTAQNGREALAAYEKNIEKIDMVILDMIMPDMGGGELYDRLKAVNNNIKALLSSGYSLNDQAAEILARGCDGFIQKPFRIEQLSLKMEEILGPITG